MNFLKKTLFLGLVPCAAVSGQGLYSIAPNDDEAGDSLPLTYIVGVSVGFDDNPNPLFGTDGEDESGFVDGFVQANWTSVAPQTTWDVFARLGARYYFDDFDDNRADQESFNARLGINFTHRFSERLRFSSRNLLAYEQEPDFDFGAANGVRAGDYFRYSTDNSIGYRWSDRLGTQTGVSFSGVTYDELDDSDFTQLTFRHDFRYRVSPATVVTAGYRYGIVDNDTGSDSDSHFLVGGVEHRISPVSAVVLRAGVQFTDPDDGSSRTRPFVEGTLRTRLTEQLSANVFVRYSNEGFNRGLTVEDPATGGFQRFVFEQSQTLRVGSRLNYVVNSQVSLFGGVSFIYTDYDDPSEETPFAEEGDESILHINAGASYRLTDNLYLTGSYNFTTAFSDFDGREYDRNRYQLGIQATF